MHFNLLVFVHLLKTSVINPETLTGVLADIVFHIGGILRFLIASEGGRWGFREGLDVGFR